MTTVAEFYSNAHIGLRFGVKNANHQSAIGHSGQDINGWVQGTWIPHFASGVVVRKVEDGGTGNVDDLGNFITIRSVIGGVGYYITHCHLASLGGTPAVGASLVFGQGVGPIGNTGYSLGTHDHIMMSTTSMYPNIRHNLIDPLPFIYAARTQTSGGGTTPIPPEPEPERHTQKMTLYLNTATLVNGAAVDGTTIYALAGDSPGTDANWLEVAPTIANAMSIQIGGSAIRLNASQFASFKAKYLQPLNSTGPTEFSAQQKFDISQAATSGASLVIDHINETPYEISLSIDSVPTTNATGTATPDPA